MFALLDVCMSSLRRGHANLHCIAPTLTDDPRREPFPETQTSNPISQNLKKPKFTKTRKTKGNETNPHRSRNPPQSVHPKRNPWPRCGSSA